MKKVILSTLMVLALSLLLLTCTDEGNPIGGNTPVVDPITRIWTNQADSSNTFFFITFDSTVVRGIFWGNEDHPTEGESDLCGFFDNLYVEFDVKRPAGGRTKFKGNFINSYRMELKSIEGSLVLTR
jgi:hypothetical protein